jgi:hypothetical protein
MKKPAQHLIAEVPHRQPQLEMTIGIDLGDVWSHYCTLNQGGHVLGQAAREVVHRPAFSADCHGGGDALHLDQRTAQELGPEVIVANGRELRSISHSDRKSDQVDAEKLARFARLDPQILRPIAHRNCAATGSPNADPGTRSHRPASQCGSQRSSWTDESLRPSDAGIRDAVFRQAQPEHYAARTKTSARSGARADRADDAQDQAVRSADPRTHTVRVSETQALLKVQGVGHITALTRYQVFVSSTYTDLINERHAAFQSLLTMGCIPAGMEWFPAETDEQWKVIRRVINDCDFYVLIIGGRYGSTTSEGLSYTEKEFDYAVTKMPVLVFCHQDPSSIPLGRSETEPKLRKSLKAFRKKAMTGRLVKFWTSADGLASQVSLAIHNTIQTHDAIGWVRGGLHSLDAPYGKTPGGGSEWKLDIYTSDVFRKLHSFRTTSSLVNSSPLDGGLPGSRHITEQFALGSRDQKHDWGSPHS